jgi:hypothetical protein
MQIVEVKTEEQKKAFLKFPIKLYKESKYWVRPLDTDIQNVFEPKKNKTFRNGECTRWILQNDKRETVGRIAAFVNHKTANKDNKQPTGGLGLFECVNDQSAAFMLFDEAKDWLTQKGMEAMDGPINFGDRDKWWGLLIDGFDQEPNYCCNYNPEYYMGFFQAYGFQIYFNQFTYKRVIKDPFHPRIQQKADKIFEDPGYTFEHLKKGNLEKYTEDFRVIYNKAWAATPGVANMTAPQAKAIMNSIKPIMDEKIIWFGYYNEDPVAFYINLPEMNQIFKYMNGKLDAIGKVKFLYHKWRKTCNKMFGLVFGVVPEHHGKGVEGALVIATAKMVQDKYPRYYDLEMNWIGDFNPKMMRVVEQVGGYINKTHATYRKLFDESQPFERCPIK